MDNKYQVKYIKEFYEFTKEQEKLKTYKFLETAFDKAISGESIYMDFEGNRINYFKSELEEELKSIVGFPEKFQNFIDELNRCLDVTGIKIHELPQRYDLYDAFINKTEPIIEKILK